MVSWKAPGEGYRDSVSVLKRVLEQEKETIVLASINTSLDLLDWRFDDARPEEIGLSFTQLRD